MQTIIDDVRPIASFGRRRVAPRVCVFDTRPHIRKFLCETIEELGFIVDDCRSAGDMEQLVAAAPDLALLGFSDGGALPLQVLHLLAARGFSGRILLIGDRGSPVLAAVQERGTELGLDMLASLDTPFQAEELSRRLIVLRPPEQSPSPPVDVEEALGCGWLEMWYQPKLDPQSMDMVGAEALIRMRHPTWGVVPPACFLPGHDDPHFGALSDFVFTKSMNDWVYFAEGYASVDLSVNLPLLSLGDPALVERVRAQLPEHPAFRGLTIEVKGSEAMENFGFARQVARQLRFYNIGISIGCGDGCGALHQLGDFPFAEIKAGRNFTSGCADDRLKRAICQTFLDVGARFGVRTVAEGVESREDFFVLRDMGFDAVQGFLFAKPMARDKFARTMLTRRVPRMP